MPIIVGLDLSGVETRPTGFCFLDDWNVKTCVVYSDEEIIKKIQGTKPKLVAIDAPLSLPAGRKSIEEKTGTHLRECDRELLRRRIRFFPVTLGPMRKLTARGIRLRKILENMHFKVVEVYPGGAQDILGIPRKQGGLDKLRRGLKKLQIKGIANAMSGDELDAITCAYVGKLFLEGKTLTYGSGDQTMIMPGS
jgi:predicted nuclease with RNAse H fold